MTKQPTNQRPVRTKLTEPPPPPPRRSNITSAPKPDDKVLHERAAQQRIAVIAAGEFAHASMRRPRASVNAANHAHQRMMHLISDEVMAIIASTTDSVAICDQIATLAGACAQEGFKLGVNHGMAR